FSPQHREALNHLIYGIQEKKGFIIITGDIGIGKTTICRSLLSILDQTVASALIFNSYVSDLELLETVNEEFGIPIKGVRRSKKRYIDLLNAFLLENFSAGRNAVLLVDEAQNLSHGVLEQIRMLSNLETEREKLLQIILVGQPELHVLLSLPALRQLNERITVRYHLSPLQEEDVRCYIEHRLLIAGSVNRLRLAPGSYRAIYRYSHGVPRRINAICDRALLIAYTKESFDISAATIREAVKDLGRPFLCDEEGRKTPWYKRSLF
ncbi:MAG: AAA family ATPase, partial [Syntrophales bacterium]